MIKLAKPFLSESSIQAVVEILKSGNLVQGKYVLEFEEALAQYIGVDNVILVSNGTAALHLALVALGIGPGDEVIVPAFTYPATANVVELVGAKPIFVDITLDDFCIDTSQIESKITRNTKAIMPVHEFGQAAKMDDITSIANKYELKIVEDAACALGTQFKGDKVGSIGDLGCFSFHPRKAITTGEGGAITTKNKYLADKIRSLRNHGINYDQNNMNFLYAGFNYRMTEFQAALGLHQLNIVNELIDKRIEQANIYNSLLNQIEWLQIPQSFLDRYMVYQTYHILVGDKISRDSIIKYMKLNSIETNLGAQAVHLQNYYVNKYHLKDSELPNSTSAYHQGLALPMGHHLAVSEIKYICNILTNYKV
ncbi:MAG: DegT/DnrJ/EryC1/StrS family aminotransferase [Melioribacteraceae bacterium]|nr:DegT/DnrJ/EryC1/StrS family aminotransferase [Melioribacteraceae bacterium]MCF8297299.1 DegT/DnrJ/EryC1/StrS family aminotransferase [Saprospiraceae bacterium]MCF8428431.1 DegT/DnrJ/EryC1/StrS family aminotransferase [Bacteroidia bacterium]